MLSLQKFRTCMRPLALVLGAGWLVASTGCYSWHAQTRPVGEVVAAAPSSVRITLGTDSTLELRSPRAATDSVIGFVGTKAGVTWRPLSGLRNRTFDSSRVALPLTSVSRIETRGLNAGRTSLAVLVAVGTVAFAYVASVMGCSDPMNCN